MTDTDHRPQLKAAEVSTEVQLDEDRGPRPAYVDITAASRSAGRSSRRTGAPARRRSGTCSWPPPGTGTGPRTTGCARPGTPSWPPGTRSAACSPSRPPSCAGGTSRARPQLEHQAAADGLLNDHLRLHKQGRDTRKARGIILAVAAVVVLVAVDAMVRFAPWWAWGILAAAAFVSLARAGRPKGKTITKKAELPAQVQPPTRT